MNKIKTKVEVDTQELEDATDLIEEVGERLNSVVPNIVIRNNENVNVTINNFNEPEKEWSREEEAAELEHPFRHAVLINPNPVGNCSNCGQLIDIREKFSFCPRCGARLDENIFNK